MVEYRMELIAKEAANLKGFERPETRWPREIDEIVAHSPLRHIPEDYRDEFARPPVRELFRALRLCLESGRVPDGDAAIQTFAVSFRATIERILATDARFAPIIPASEIRRLRGQFERFSYRSIELDILKAWLKPGERILEVTLRRVRTDSRELERLSISAMGMPVTTTRTASWLAQFPTSSELDALELDLAFPPAPPWASNRNVDV